MLTRRGLFVPWMIKIRPNMKMDERSISVECFLSSFLMNIIVEKVNMNMRIEVARKRGLLRVLVGTCGHQLLENVKIFSRVPLRDNIDNWSIVI